MIGAFPVIAWVMTVGLAVIALPALTAEPVPLGTAELLGLAIVGICNNAGLLMAYAALRIGQVSIVAPIVATEGAGAALLSIALGEPLGLPMAVVLGVIAVGVVLAAIERSNGGGPRRIEPETARRAALLAIAASVTFSVGLVTAGRLGTSVPIAWILLASRLAGTFGIALPLLLTRRLRLTRSAAPLVLLAGLLEVSGTALYVLAAKDGVAAAAVLSSQFAAIAAIGAFVLFGERLQRVQVAGVALIAVGVTALAAVQA